MKYSIAAVIYYNHESGDLVSELFETLAEAEEFVQSPEHEEFKAKVVKMNYIGFGDYALAIEDHT